MAARWALLRTSARSMPVVSESPPAPGLSWVSAITIGLFAVFASSIACSTPSSGVIDAAVEIVLVADNDVHDGIGRGVGMRLRHAVGEHARPAIPEVGGRKPRRKRQCRHRVVLQRRELLVDALGRLVVGALPADRNQERQLPERLGEFLPGAEQQRQMFGAGAAGVGHVDMRIGAVGDQCVRMLHHFRRHVGVQVEADHQRQVLADHLTHTPQDFAFAIVEMLGDHGAVQVEIDGIERSGRGDAVDDHLDDALDRHPR